MCQKWPQNRAFLIFWKSLLLVFPGNNLKWKLMLLVIFHKQSCWPIKLLDSLKCNISSKKWIMKFIYGMQINMKVFYKLIISVLVCVAKHAQSTKNKMFPYLCNISRKTWEMKLMFCLQINTNVFCNLKVSLSLWVARHV